MTAAIIMAAEGNMQMQSSKPRELHEICGRPMIDYVLEAVSEISDYDPMLVLSHGSEEIESYLGLAEGVKYAYIEQKFGALQAIVTARDYLEDKEGFVLILTGDMPLMTGKMLKDVVQFAEEGSYHAVVLSTKAENPRGYEGPSIYCFDILSLLESLDGLDANNAKGRDGYCLRDLLKVLESSGKRTGVYELQDSTGLMRVTNRIELARADKAMRLRINYGHMEKGVTIIDPESTYISSKVIIGSGTVIYPGNVLEGNTIIGEGCILYPNNRIVDSKIGSGTQIQTSVILNSQIGEETTVGPFAYIRPDSIIGDRVRIGDFVEIKKSRIGDGSKISHLTYVGDGIVGKDVNLGCGVIFVNYDGEKKHTTIVEDRAFVGCNTNLVAPVKVGHDAFVAAGSTVTEDVPEGSLAIARSRQINKEGWVEKRKKERR